MAFSEQQSRAVDLAVDVGFGVLLVVCGIRYSIYHAFEGTGVVVLALAILSGLSYAWAVIARRGLGTSERAGLLVATGLWIPLVVLAPSFGWCAFALFFAIHRVLSSRAALSLSACIVVAVSVGLFLMSSGQDLGLVLGPFFGGLVIAYAYWALDRALAEQRRLYSELVDTQDRLARSEREAGALAERERLASELHDTVVQRTAGALLLLESDTLGNGGADGSAAPTRATAQAQEALRQALIETRQLMHGLADPQSIAQSSLTGALRTIAEQAQASFSVEGDEQAVTEQVSHALQRVTQEALVNVRKHAGAERSRVTVTFFPDSVRVDIADNGVGFDPRSTDEGPAPTVTEPGAGFGIRAMTWRMRSLGGSLTIESQRGRGTVVAAAAPYRGDDDA